YLGENLISSSWLSGNALDDLDEVAVSGGRLILSFFPVNEKPVLILPELDQSQTDFKPKPKEKVNDEPAKQTAEPEPATDSKAGRVKEETKGTKETKDSQDKKIKDQKAGDQPGKTAEQEPSTDRGAGRVKDETKDSKDKKIKDQKAGDQPKKKDPFAKSRDSLAKHWGLEMAFFNKWDPVQGGEAKPKKAGQPTIPWHSALFFHNLNGAWQVLFTVRGQPVIIERQYGRGSIVLCSDTYFFSNEAIKTIETAELLAGLIGPNRRIVFDEAHFGVLDDPGVAGLARKYRLHGLLLGLLVLAGLFIWKNSSSLLPAVEDDQGESTTLVISFRDYTAGMISLLRRGLPKAQILMVCWREWKSSPAAPKQEDDRSLSSAETIVNGPKARTDPVQAYLEIQQILSEGKKTWKRTPTT
ncbi:MAG: hypothetical protein HQK55_08265, partial [Deltaproteobacteria bacterium]|nr:hypothetical protein [Deltaproteobacteria bacterium]